MDYPSKVSGTHRNRLSTSSHIRMCVHVRLARTSLANSSVSLSLTLAAKNFSACSAKFLGTIFQRSIGAPVDGVSAVSRPTRRLWDQKSSLEMRSIASFPKKKVSFEKIWLNSVSNPIYSLLFLVTNRLNRKSDAISARRGVDQRVC